MIQKLRRQFILVAMCSTLAVLTVIIGALNIVNYVSLTSQKDTILGLLSDNGGKFPNMFDPMRNGEDFPIVPPEQRTDENRKNQDFRRDFRRNFTRETEYETRFFTVTMENDGTVISSDLGMIAAIEENVAKEYAGVVLSKYQTRERYHLFHEIDHSVDLLLNAMAPLGFLRFHLHDFDVRRYDGQGRF